MSFLKFTVAATITIVTLSASFGAAGLQCDAAEHAGRVVNGCAYGASPLSDCCEAIHHLIDDGGFPCFCEATQMPELNVYGYNSYDMLKWYEACSGTMGNAQDLAAVCADPGDLHGTEVVLNDPTSTGSTTTTPPPPGTPVAVGAPPPPATGGHSQGHEAWYSFIHQPWYAWVLEAVICVVGTLILIFGLLGCVRRGGPEGRLSEKMLESLWSAAMSRLKGEVNKDVPDQNSDSSGD